MASHMNNTRWRVILPLLKDVARRIDVKWILDDESNGWTNRYLIPTDGYFEPLPLGPIAFREIEWILIDPIEFQSVKEKLIYLKLPITVEGQYLKIWGYTHHATNFV